MKRLLHCIALIFVIVFVLASCTAEKGIQSTVINEDGELVLTYIDGSTENLGVIKGEQGIQGEKGDKGDKGDDGLTPTIEISDDGYWVINGKKTNVKAKAEEGKDAENSQNADENPQGLAFFLKDDGTYAVGIGNAVYLSKIIIPSSYKNVAVTEIAVLGPSKEITETIGMKMKTVIIPDSITKIGYDTFFHCDALTDVYYTGSQEQWNSIDIDESCLSDLHDCEIHFNYIPE